MGNRSKLEVAAFVNDCRADELSGSSIRNALTAWSRVIDAAVAVGTIERNYVLEFSRGRIRNDAAVMRPPLGDEFERLLAEIEARMPAYALYAQFLFYTGCRATEALLVTRQDVFADQHGDFRLHLHAGTKGGRARAPLLNRAEELLPRLPAHGRLFPALSTNVAVVSSQWGRWMAARAAEEQAAAQREGRQVDPWKLRRWRLHDHRHGFAIAALLDGADIYDLQQHLGHASVTTTEGYVRAIDQMPVAQRRSLRLTWTKGRRSNPGTEAQPPDPGSDFTVEWDEHRQEYVTILPPKPTRYGKP